MLAYFEDNDDSYQEETAKHFGVTQAAISKALKRYSARGVKVAGKVSDKKFKKTSIIATKTCRDIIAPLQYQGSMDSVLFEHWFEFYLIPLLLPNSTAVLDNASFHNKKRLVVPAEKYGHKIIFLPPYSPELNAIVHFVTEYVPAHTIDILAIEWG